VQQVNIHEAKTNLSKLVDRAVSGHPFIIAKQGHPMVLVQALNETDLSPRKHSRVGFLKDQLAGFVVPEDFNTMIQDEIIALFEGTYEDDEQ
jgi:prevent-host-death family protein